MCANVFERYNFDKYKNNMCVNLVLMKQNFTHTHSSIAPVL